MNYEDFLMTIKIREMMPYMRGPILDVGCGAGLMFKQLDSSYIEIGDMAIDKLLEPEGLPEEIEYIQSDFLKLKIDRKFGLIVAFNILEHVIDPMAFLIKCESLLASWGKIIVSVPNVEAFHKYIGSHLGYPMFILSDEEKKQGHKHTFTKTLLEVYLEQAGFLNTFVWSVNPKPMSSEMMEKLMNENYWEACYLAGKDIDVPGSLLMGMGEKA